MVENTHLVDICYEGLVMDSWPEWADQWKVNLEQKRRGVVAGDRVLYWRVMGRVIKTVKPHRSHVCRKIPMLHNHDERNICDSHPPLSLVNWDFCELFATCQQICLSSAVLRKCRWLFVGERIGFAASFCHNLCCCGFNGFVGRIISPIFLEY